MSARSMTTRSPLLKLQGGRTNPRLWLPGSEGRDDGLGHSYPSLPQLSIHQVLMPKATTPQPKPSTSSNENDNIPGFKDPELVGGGGNDSLEKLTINLPPDIYNSQILHMVKSPERAGPVVSDGAGDGENEHVEVGDTGFKVITETNKSTQSLTGFISLSIGMLFITVRVCVQLPLAIHMTVCSQSCSVLVALASVACSWPCKL